LVGVEKRRTVGGEGKVAVLRPESLRVNTRLCVSRYEAVRVVADDVPAVVGLADPREDDRA
jgi:hypothetical protein